MYLSMYTDFHEAERVELEFFPKSIICLKSYPTLCAVHSIISDSKLNVNKHNSTWCLPKIAMSSRLNCRHQCKATTT